MAPIPARSSSTASQPNDQPQPTKLPVASQRVEGPLTDVWTLFNQYTAKYKAINLGQGFMGFPAPQFVKDAGSAAAQVESCMQYAPPRGVPDLRAELAKNYSQFLDRPVDPNANIVVTAGGNEALISVLAAFLDPGDEAVMMEPAFDQYFANLKLLSAVPKYVPLRVRPGVDATQHVIPASDWVLDIDELRAAITPRTKVLIINTPHNPIGKVFTYDELQQIGQVAQEHNLVILSDEVYDRLTYDGHTHHSIATLPGMWNRTVIACSAGKTFGVTGWRIGWMVGAEHLILPCLRAHTRLIFTVNSPMQLAIANAFKMAHENDFFNTQRQEYWERRHHLCQSLDAIGLPYTIPDGSYFILANTGKVKIPADFEFPPEVSSQGRCYEMCYFFTKEIGVTGIPPSEFYSDEHTHLADNYIRLAFCKPVELLDQAGERLLRLKQFM
ncbi:arylformamidase [Dimargaris xerosporica]|nr:arylformamidase [Dimargaris xerosporica]